MKLILPLQSLIALDFPASGNICSRVRACFDTIDAELRHEILLHVHKDNIHYAEPVLPFFAITRSVVTEITRMMCEVQKLPFKGLSEYGQYTSYPSIEVALDYNGVDANQFFVRASPASDDLDPYLEPSLDRSALIQYLIDNGRTDLTVEI